MMRRHILFVAFVAVSMCPSMGLASYLVQLTNGNQFITYGYYEDGSQIRFYSDGGAVAVPKAAVRQIKKSDIPVTEPTESQPVILSPKAPQRLLKDDGWAEEAGGGAKKSGAIASLDDYKQAKRLLRAELDKALAGFRLAAGQGNEAAKKKAITDITAASARVFRLTEEVKKRNNGILPDWWEGL
jgi:predicted Zn-dependent protease